MSLAAYRDSPPRPAPQRSAVAQITASRSTKREDRRVTRRINRSDHAKCHARPLQSVGRYAPNQVRQNRRHFARSGRSHDGKVPPVCVDATGIRQRVSTFRRMKRKRDRHEPHRLGTLTAIQTLQTSRLQFQGSNRKKAELSLSPLGHPCNLRSRLEKWRSSAHN